MAVRRLSIPAAYRPATPPASVQPPPPFRGFRPPPKPPAEVEGPPREPLRESLVSEVQMKRLHAIGREVGLDHAALRAIAVEVDPGVASSGMRSMTTTTWSRVMCRLADRHGAAVRLRERQAGDEFEGRSAFVSGLVAEMERSGVAAQVRAALRA